MSHDRSLLARSTTSQAVADHLGLLLYGPDGEVARFSSFPAAGADAICFLQGKLPDGVKRAPGFALVVAHAEAVESLRTLGYSVIASPYPKFHFAKALADLCVAKPSDGVHPTAVVAGDVQLSGDVSIGPYAVLSGRIRIGAGSVVGANVRLMNDVRIGSRCTIRSGTAIGGDAFNLGLGPSGATTRLPSFGGVDISDDVDIGHNVVISRAVDGDTSVGSGVRINDLTMIGNAVSIAEHAVIMANCMVGGRARLGRACWIGMAANILESVSIGDGAKVGMGSVVLEDVPARVIVVGAPARYLRENA